MKSSDMFYRVVGDDSRCRDRWFLDGLCGSSGAEIDLRLFTYGETYTGDKPARIEVREKGKIVRFSLAAFDAPVVTEDVRSILRQGDPEMIQEFPVAASAVADRFFIINVLRCVACLDEKRSEVMKWQASDGRPDKIGKYRMVINLTIEPGKVQGLNIFRIAGWEIALIVSRQLKEALESIPDLGIGFQMVS